MLRRNANDQLTCAEYCRMKAAMKYGYLWESTLNKPSCHRARRAVWAALIIIHHHHAVFLALVPKQLSRQLVLVQLALCEVHSIYQVALCELLRGAHIHKQVRRVICGACPSCGLHSYDAGASACCRCSHPLARTSMDLRYQLCKPLNTDTTVRLIPGSCH